MRKDRVTGEPLIEYLVDPQRHDITRDTGIYVRAKLGDKWGSYDIAELDAKSLLAWLRSRGGENRWAENCVGLLLGHKGNIA